MLGKKTPYNAISLELFMPLIFNHYPYIFFNSSTFNVDW